MTDTESLRLLGLFYGQYNTAIGEATPSTEMTIKQEELTALGETGTFVGRFVYQNTSGKVPTIVTRISIDGASAQDFGGFNKLPGQAGTVDLPVFKYPNSASARDPGKHVITITPGLHWAIFGSPNSYETVWPETTWFNPVTINVTIV